MIFEPLRLKGAYLIKPEPYTDERGFFIRTFCKREFQAHSLVDEYVQCNISYNKKKGTLRGMHYQLPPHQETKLVRCTRGAVYDVIVDIRKKSPTFKQWMAVELTHENCQILYIPEGFAHGFLTLQNDSEVFYQMSIYYASEFATGFRWNDHSFMIQWVEPILFVSDKDQSFPGYGKKM